MNTKSPFDKFFNTSIDHVPQVFQDQFLLTTMNGPKIILEGEMEEVWHRPRFIAPLFWMMGKLGFFIPYIGKNIPAKVEIIAKEDKNGEILHVFNRQLSFPKAFSFNSIMLFDNKKGELAEMLGPFNILYFTWVANFEKPNKFRFVSSKMALQIFGIKIWLPRFIWKWFGFVEFIQIANEDGSTTIELTVKIPVLGDFFGYKGRFRVLKQ